MSGVEDEASANCASVHLLVDAKCCRLPGSCLAIHIALPVRRHSSPERRHLLLERLAASAVDVVVPRTEECVRRLRELLEAHFGHLYHA